MRIVDFARIVCTVLAVSHAGTGTAAERPEWAFFIPAPESKQLETPSEGTGAIRWSPAGSTKSYSITQLQDVLEPPDWYSDEHPAMPQIVAHGIRGGAGEPPQRAANARTLRGRAGWGLSIPSE